MSTQSTAEASEGLVHHFSGDLVGGRQRRKTVRLIAILLPLVIAICFRLWGISWAAPERTDLHPDEHDYVIGHARNLIWTDLDPKFLNYPTLLCYSTALVNDVLIRAGIIREEWKIYLVGRSIVAGYGALSCFVVFLLAEALGASLPGAFLASLWVAILPLHVWESHIAVTDVVMTFWIMVTLLASVRLLRHSRPVDYLFAGVALGLAVGSKYTAALAGIAPLVAVVVGKKDPLKAVRGLVLLGLSALAACFAVTPYSFIRLQDVLAAMAYEGRHVHSHHNGFSLPAVGPQYHKFVYQLVAAWPFSLGVALHLSAAIGTLWAIARWKKEYAVPLSFAVLYFSVTGSWTFTPLRYYLPLLVLGALFAGLWQGDWLITPNRSKRSFAAILVAVTFCYTLAFTLSTTRRYTNDTRVQAAAWLRDQGAAFKKILLVGDRHYLGTLLGDERITVKNESVLDEFNKDYRSGYDLVELTSLHYLRWERHGNKNYLQMYDNFRTGKNHFVLLKRFEADFLNKKWYSALDPMFGCYFISPTLEFYRKADTKTAPENTSATRL